MDIGYKVFYKAAFGLQSNIEKEQILSPKKQGHGPIGKMEKP